MSRSPIPVLVIDDDFGVPGSTFEAKYGVLESRDRPYRFHYSTAWDGEAFTVAEALAAAAAADRLAVVLLDIKFGTERDRLGLEILEALRSRHPALPIVMLTSLGGDVEALERAMELGANEYLVKSPSVATLERVLRLYTGQGEDEESAIWGNTQTIRTLRARMARLAAGASVPVLITGETGTGKELVARGIHRLGPRHHKAFVAKNCAHSDTSLLDAELFGQERGRYTGAETAAGLVEQAEGGVLFLDEIGSMPMPLQGKLLRLLENRTYRPVGASAERRADFQLVSATNRDLAAMVRQGTFASDLYYRIRGVEVEVPPLRERLADLPVLAEVFLKRYRRQTNDVYPAARITDRALAALRTTAHEWPGNARELRNLVEWCCTMARTPAIDVGDLPPPFSRFTGAPPPPPTDESSLELIRLPLLLARMELGMIREAMARTGGNKAAVMKRLYDGLPSHYYYRLIYDAVRRAPAVLDEYPEFRSDYLREAKRRGGVKSGRAT